MNPYILTHFAEQDLNDIWDHIAMDNLDAADRVHQRLESAMRKLAKTPRIGHFREDLADRR
jgi:plasmid stabilization system protein ParE